MKLTALTSDVVAIAVSGMYYSYLSFFFFRNFRISSKFKIHVKNSSVRTSDYFSHIVRNCLVFNILSLQA